MGHRSEPRQSHAGSSTLVVPRARLTPSERLLVGFELFVAVGAFAGGGTMVVDSTGRTLDLPRELLDNTPFASFLVPGIVLLILNGFIPAAVAIRAIRRRPVAGVGHLVVALVLGGWITAETALIGMSNWMQPAFLGLAMAIGALAVSAYRRTPLSVGGGSANRQPGRKGNGGSGATISGHGPGAVEADRAAFVEAAQRTPDRVSNVAVPACQPGQRWSR